MERTTRHTWPVRNDNNRYDTCELNLYSDGAAYWISYQYEDAVTYAQLAAKPRFMKFSKLGKSLSEGHVPGSGDTECDQEMAQAVFGVDFAPGTYVFCQYGGDPPWKERKPA